MAESRGVWSKKDCVGPELALKVGEVSVSAVGSLASIWKPWRQGVTIDGDLSEHAEGSVLEYR